MLLEEGIHVIEERATDFPMNSRKLGPLLNVDQMTVYRHGRKLALPRGPTWERPYTLKEALAIWDSICRTRMYSRKPRKKYFVVSTRLKMEDYWEFVKIAERKDRTPDSLLYAIVRRYVRKNKEFF